MRVSSTHNSRLPRFGVALAAAWCALAVLLAGCGVSATAAAPSASTTTAATQAALGTAVDASSTATARDATGAELFDSSIVHKITVSFAQEDYDAMIKTYSSTAEKDWIEADITIDGVSYADVGMRLKGNSSIMGLRDGGRTGGPGGDSSSDAPEGLPWLIRLDRNVDGQNHGGITELVVRSSTTETALNEALALELLELAGLASQEAIAASFSVNGSRPALRLVVEHPDDTWMAENLDAGGALYKAESTGDYSYRGDDPASYDEVFDQAAGKHNADLTPLIEFLDFVNNSGDATFTAELADRLDVESFATYLAMEELLANSDDIDGPGNNSYLYYDPGTDRFTVVPWDHNLAFGGMGRGGGSAGGDAATPPGAGVEGFDGELPDGMGAPNDMRLPGGQAPDGADTTWPVPTQGGPQGRLPGEGGPGRFGGRSNILVERCKADPEFEALYEQRLAELRSELYENGTAESVLSQWVVLLETQAPDLVDGITVQEESARISAYLTAQ